MNSTDAKDINTAYSKAVNRIKYAVINEQATLESINELVADKKKTGKYISKMKGSIAKLGMIHLETLAVHMKSTADRLKVKPASISRSALEKKAGKIVPKQTSKVKENGYRGYRALVDQVDAAIKEKYPYGRRDIASTSELQCLINGKNSVLDIKNMLDVQHARSSDLQSVINYIEILKSAGLVVY